MGFLKFTPLRCFQKIFPSSDNIHIYHSEMDKLDNNAHGAMYPNKAKYQSTSL